MNASSDFAIHTDNGLIPGQSQPVDVTELSWIPGIRRGTVVTAMEDDEDFGLTLWVYARFEGEGLARMLYKGNDWTAARQARSEFVADRTKTVELASVSTAGVRVAEPTEAKMTVYRTTPAVALAPQADTDPDTGLPVVTVGGRRYVVGLVRIPAPGYPAYVRYWLADSTTGFSNIWRAYDNDSHGTTGRAVWDAQRLLRNG